MPRSIKLDEVKTECFPGDKLFFREQIFKLPRSPTDLNVNEERVI